MIRRRQILELVAGVLVLPAFGAVAGAAALAADSGFPRCRRQTPAQQEASAAEAFYIPAVDGTRLALDLIMPAMLQSGKRVPTVLIMTRYWRDEIGQPLDSLATFYSTRGFAAVIGDVRGTGASFGVWPYHRSRAETRDFTAVMDWIVRQPWSNGSIVGIGSSYTANTADWMAERNHPALKAIVPRFADYDPYADLYFPGGVPNAFMGRTWGERVKDLDRNIATGQGGLPSRGVRPVDGAEGTQLLAQALAEHAPVPSVWEGLRAITFRDDRPESWGGASMADWAISGQADAVGRSGVPIQTWAGWMDSGTANGVIHRFLAIPNPQRAFIGPWSHGGAHASDPLHPAAPNADLDPIYAQQLAADLCFVTQCLDGDAPQRGDRVLRYFTVGEGRWKSTTVWPLRQTHSESWYFANEGALSIHQCAPASDRYAVDFGVGSGTSNRWATNNDGRPVDYGDRAAIDQRLLTYTSAPLGTAIEITGHPIVHLFIASTHDDGNFIVYLECVAPDGSVAYLTEGQLRAIHRRLTREAPPNPIIGPHHSFLRRDALPLVPAQVAELSFATHPLSVRVPAGYRLRVAICGADADVFTRIPSVGDPVWTVHRGGARSSRIELPLIPLIA